MEGRMTDPDVIVIGAGPAGACAAIAAAHAGARVMLVERTRFPRPKVCGCCLSDAAVAGLEAIGAHGALHGAVPIDAVRIATGAGEARFPRAGGVALSRMALDARLAAHAAAQGVHVLEGTGARVLPGGTVTLGSDPANALRPACTIVADGLGGTSLDGVPDFEWRIDPRNRIGFGAVLPAGAVECALGEIRMHVARAGYVGAVRLEDGSIDVAAAVRPEALRAIGGPAACARAWLGHAVLRRDAVDAARWRGTPALTRRRASLAAPRILVAGDAAGYVEPFTGEGMGWAIATGAAAGRLAASMRAAPDAWREWPDRHRALVRAQRLRCRAIALTLRSPLLVTGAIAVARIAPRALGAVARGVGRRTSSIAPPTGAVA
jgi:flavin-dependent dehydrogenase